MSTGVEVNQVMMAVRDTMANSTAQGWLAAQSVILSWVVPAVVAALVSWLVCWRTLRSGARDRLNAQIDRLVELGIEYPLMEDDQWCDSWSRENRTVDGMRYDSYCCSVFNLLENLWSFNHKCARKTQGMFDADELIWRHRRWWQEYIDNQSSYPAGFQKYVTGELKKQRKSSE